MQTKMDKNFEKPIKETSQRRKSKITNFTLGQTNKQQNTKLQQNLSLITLKEHLRWEMILRKH